jgi:hypothetical protein
MHGVKMAGWVLAAWLLAAPLAFGGSAVTTTDLATGGDLSVRVVVEPFSPETRGIGLDRDALQLRVEQRLRAEGLVILDDAAWRRRPGTPTLFVRVDVATDAVGARYGGEVRLERPAAGPDGVAARGATMAVWRQAIAGGPIQQLTLVATKFFSWRGRSHEPGSRTGHLAYITNAALATVDAFSAEFLAANGP